jgi:hypothetical protein
MSAKPKRKRLDARDKLTPDLARRIVQNLLDQLHGSVVLLETVVERLHQPKPKDPPAAIALLAIMRLLVVYYLDLARRGHPGLIAELPIYTRQMVEALAELSEHHPELLARTAEHEIDWPIMASRNYPKEADFRKLADRIRLGTKTVVSLSPSKKFKPHTPLNRFLLHLLGGTLATNGQFYFLKLPESLPRLTPKTLPYLLDEVIMPVIDRLHNTEGSWAGVPELAAIVKRLPYESEHRSAIRNRIKKALRGMADGAG